MQEEKIYKYRLKITKNKELRFISHLDWQNLILKIFRRCELKLVLSQGFNKMPKVSFSPALPIFLESDCELVNFQTHNPLKNNFCEEFKKYSPNGIEIIELKEINSNSNEPKSLENFEKIRYIIEKCLSSNELFITKKTKKGIEKTINYRNSLKSFEIKDDGVLCFILKAGQNEEIPSLRADEFLKTVFGESNTFKIKRVKFFDTDLRII